MLYSKNFCLYRKRNSTIKIMNQILDSVLFTGTYNQLNYLLFNSIPSLFLQ